MRNLKKFLALVLAMMMAVSLMVTADAKNPEREYPDMGSVTEAFEEAVDTLTGMRIFKGDNGNFKPQASIMRSEAVAVLYRLVTGDVTDSQAKLYSPLAVRFNDVSADAWYAGYVGFAVDAGYINGYNGDFMPNKPVTGYEMLKMLLKAVGYGKNGEYTGSLWQINVGSQAQALGILTKINSTHYANTLSQPSAREVVAELTFYTAAYVPTVRYEYGYYNQYKGVAIAQGDNELNPTLGQIKFGLTSLTGIVVGNQATGEDDTLVSAGVDAVYRINADSSLTLLDVVLNGSVSYSYDDVDPTDTTSGNVAFGFDAETGLDLFGHKVKVWSNSNGHAYSVLDRAEKVEYVYAENGILADAGATNAKLGAAAAAKGFKVQSNTSRPNSSTAYFSDRYSQMDTTRQPDMTTAGGTDSPISTYALISNNGNLTVDVVIALSAEVAEITQKNTTSKTPYVVLGSTTPNVSTFGNGTTAGIINLSQLTAESVQDLGETVTAYEIAGTGETLATAAGKVSMGDAAFMYQLEKMKTFTATVSSYKVQTPSGLTIDTTSSAVISVNLVGRSESMLLSGITRGDGTNSEIISRALPVVGSLRANTTYTVYEDIVGRFISLTTGSDYEFLYGTYADFEVGGLGTGTITYNMVGVNWSGKIQGANTLKSFAGTGMDGNEYNTNITTTRKDYGDSSGTGIGNQLMPGFYTGYLYNATTGDLRASGATRMADAATWTITSTNASNGFVKVNNSADGTSGTDYLLTKDTHFIVVSGTGTATLKVQEYKGLADFLQGAAEAQISYNNFTGSNGDGNEVIFKTSAEKYGTVDTEDNGVITDIILSTGNVNRWNTTSMFFNYDQATDTGMVLPGAPANVLQYELWSNGEAGYYFVKIDAVGGTNPNTPMTFYNLVQIGEASGVPYYKAVEAPVNNGQGNLSGAGYASDSATYEYITVSTLDTGLFKDTNETAGKVFSIANAKVCDVQAKTGGASGRNEITTLRELNNAVSVRQPDGSTLNYTINVAIVYSGINVSCIYVTNVT